MPFLNRDLPFLPPTSSIATSGQLERPPAHLPLERHGDPGITPAPLRSGEPPTVLTSYLDDKHLLIMSFGKRGPMFPKPSWRRHCEAGFAGWWRRGSGRSGQPEPGEPHLPAHTSPTFPLPRRSAQAQVLAAGLIR